MKLVKISKEDREELFSFLAIKNKIYSNLVEELEEDRVEQMLIEENNNFKILDKDKIIGFFSYFFIPILGKNYVELKIRGSEEEMMKSMEEIKKIVKGISPDKDKFFFLIEEDNSKIKNFISSHYYLSRKLNLNNSNYLEFAVFLRDYTYSVHSDYLTDKEIDSIFSKRGNWRKFSSKDDKNVDFLYVDGKHTYSKEIYNKYKKVLLKNQISDHKNITRKDQLYTNLEPRLGVEKYLLENYRVDLNNPDLDKIESLFKTGKAWIFKPVSGWAGVGIEVFGDYQKFKSYLESLDKKNFFRNLKEKNYWVLQEYVLNPILYQGRKFHMRVYYLVFEEKNYLYSKSQIYTAKKKFEKANYWNKDIHDTHIEGSLPNLFFPDSLNLPKSKINLIQGRLIDLFEKLNLIKEYKCFDESKQCYELLGADVILTEKYEVKMIEVNSKIGYKTFKGSNFNVNLIDSEFDAVIDTIFPPKNKIEQSGDYFFIPINRF